MKEIEEKIEKIFPKNSTTVVYLTSIGYLAVMNTSLYSLIEHCGDERLYDIIVLNIGVDRFDQASVKRLAQDKSNISIRFFEVNDLVQGQASNIYLDAGMNVSSIRVLLPWILREYDRILYLGSDTILRCDVAELFAQTIHGRKLVLSGDAKRGIDPDVMLMDLKGIRSKFTQNESIETLNKCGGDSCLALSAMLNNHMCPIPQEWDVWPVYEDESRIDVIRAQAKLIHYTGSIKPWVNPLMPMSEDWWAVARQTDYYEEIIRRMCQYVPDNRSGMRVVLDELFPVGTKRRELVKRIINPFKRKEQQGL